MPGHKTMFQWKISGKVGKWTKFKNRLCQGVKQWYCKFCDKLLPAQNMDYVNGGRMEISSVAFMVMHSGHCNDQKI